MRTKTQDVTSEATNSDNHSISDETSHSDIAEEVSHVYAALGVLHHQITCDSALQVQARDTNVQGGVE